MDGREKCGLFLVRLHQLFIQSFIFILFSGGINMPYNDVTCDKFQSLVDCGKIPCHSIGSPATIDTESLVQSAIKSAVPQIIQSTQKICSSMIQDIIKAILPELKATIVELIRGGVQDTPARQPLPSFTTSSTVPQHALPQAAMQRALLETTHLQPPPTTIQDNDSFNVTYANADDPTQQPHTMNKHPSILSLPQPLAPWCVLHMLLQILMLITWISSKTIAKPLSHSIQLPPLPINQNKYDFEDIPRDPSSISQQTGTISNSTPLQYVLCVLLLYSVLITFSQNSDIAQIMQ